MAVKLNIQITEVGARDFGTRTARSRGMVVTLSGHYTIEGREVARFGETYREICWDCDGTGYRPGYGFSDGSRCWPCNYSGLRGSFGTGTALELARKLRDRARAAERRIAKAAAAHELAKAKHAAWLADNAEVQAWIADFGHLLDSCAHVLEGRERGEYRECYREECEARYVQVRRDYDIQLLEIAARAANFVLTDGEMALMRKLAATHAKRVEARAAKAVQVAARTWVGEEGAKVTVTGVLAEAKHFEREIGYGRTSTSTLYKLTTADGNVVTWFRTGFYDFAAGEAVTLTGTVKALKESEKYGKETQLTRCKIS